MSMRKTVILDEMIHLVGSKDEIAKYNSLYELRNKGSATSYAMRIIRDHLVILVNKKQTNTPLSDSSGQERIIKFNEYGRSWLEKS